MFDNYISFQEITGWYILRVLLFFILSHCNIDMKFHFLGLLKKNKLGIGPTITAHPTEAKRVSVLEIHRRIYQTLVKFDSFRWGPKEILQLEKDLEGEIDLLWLTGELRLERPSLEAEIEWGLQFYKTSLFEALPRVFESYDEAYQFGADHYTKDGHPFEANQLKIVTVQCHEGVGTCMRGLAEIPWIMM